MSEGLEHACTIQLREIRSEDESQRVTGPTHPQRGNEEQHQNSEQDGQKEFGDPFDALLYAEVHGGDCRDTERQRDSELKCSVPRLSAKEISHIGVSGEPTDHPGRRLREVVERPPRDHRVVAEQHEPAQYPPKAEPPPCRTDDILQCADHALLAPPADQQLGHHDRQAHRRDTHQVDEHECAAVILPRDEREFPKVAQPDGATGRRQDEAHVGTPMFAGLAHRLRSVGRQTQENCGPGRIRNSGPTYGRL